MHTDRRNVMFDHYCSILRSGLQLPISIASSRAEKACHGGGGGGGGWAQHLNDEGVTIAGLWANILGGSGGMLPPEF